MNKSKAFLWVLTTHSPFTIGDFCRNFPDTPERTSRRIFAEFERDGMVKEIGKEAKGLKVMQTVHKMVPVQAKKEYDPETVQITWDGVEMRSMSAKDLDWDTELQGRNPEPTKPLSGTIRIPNNDLSVEDTWRERATIFGFLHLVDKIGGVECLKYPFHQTGFGNTKPTGHPSFYMEAAPFFLLAEDFYLEGMFQNGQGELEIPRAHRIIELYLGKFTRGKCPKCKEWKPREHFSSMGLGEDPNTGKLLKARWWCKSCEPRNASSASGCVYNCFADIASKVRTGILRNDLSLTTQAKEIIDSIISQHGIPKRYL